MREIKFRGKRVTDGKWVHGDLVHSQRLFDEHGNVPKENECIISSIQTTETDDDINPETIGQFTGLRDKHGKEIYEGDILETEDWEKIPNSLEHSICSLPLKVIEVDGAFRVRWTNEKPSLPQDKPYQLLSGALYQPFLRSGLIVIGNIHDKEASK